MARHCFIVTYNSQRKSKPRSVNPPPNQIDNRGKDNQIKINVRLGKIGQDI